MMDDRESFEFTYSAPEQEEIRRIREKYLPKQESKLDQLRRLDESVTRKGTVVSLIVGIIGTLIMGAGMSMCMVWTDILLTPGIAVGLVGMVGVALAFPLYQRITARERERIAPEILRLSEELEHGN